MSNLQAQSNFKKETDSVKNCLLYARVSTERQVKQGHSLSDQINRLADFAKKHDWHILGVYKDGGKSGGTTSGRPEFTKMLERCRNDPDIHAVLLEETDRFARDAEDHLAVKSFLKKHDVQLIATQQPNFGDDPVGKFIDLVMAGVNQLQREITGEKTRRTMIALAKRGFQPGPAVIGYLNSYEKDVPWHIDKERACFIKDVFKLYNTGNYSIYQIEEKLYDEGFRTTKGNKVRASVIHRILTDVRYAGKVKYIGKIYEGKHKPIVKMDQIEKAKSVLNEHNKGADRSRKHNWFLAGLVYCKECGSLMSGEEHEKKSGKVYRYYRCLGPKNKDKECNQPYAPMEKIHKQLNKHITEIKFGKRFLKALRQELNDVMNEQGEGIPDQIESLQKRRNVIDKKMSKLEDQLIKEIIPEKRLRKKYNPLKKELKAVESQIAKLKRPSANLTEEKIETIIKFLKDLPKLYKAFTKNQRKKFLKWFVKKAWIEDKNVVEITYTDAFQAVIDMDLVRITDALLPGLDSDQRPTAYTKS